MTNVKLLFLKASLSTFDTGSCRGERGNTPPRVEVNILRKWDKKMFLQKITEKLENWQFKFKNLNSPTIFWQTFVKILILVVTHVQNNYLTTQLLNPSRQDY